MTTLSHKYDEPSNASQFRRWLGHCSYAIMGYYMVADNAFTSLNNMFDDDDNADDNCRN